MGNGHPTAPTPGPPALATAEKAQLPEQGQPESPHSSPYTYLLAVLAGQQPSNRGHVVDVLGSRAQQVAWDVVLVLLWLGGLKHVALPHAGGHHHLGADSWLSPLALEARLRGPPSGPRGDSTPLGGGWDTKAASGGSPRVGPEVTLRQEHSHPLVFSALSSTKCHAWRTLGPWGLYGMVALARKQRRSVQLDDPGGCRRGCLWADGGGPPLGGVPLPQDTSHLHALQKGLPASCPDRRIQSHLRARDRRRQWGQAGPFTGGARGGGLSRPQPPQPGAAEGWAGPGNAASGPLSCLPPQCSLMRLLTRACGTPRPQSPFLSRWRDRVWV